MLTSLEKDCKRLEAWPVYRLRPREIVAKLNAELTLIKNTDDMKESLGNSAPRCVGPPEALGTFIVNE